jgi:hypothetical protein
MNGRMSVTKELERKWKWSWSINTFSALTLTDWEKDESPVFVPGH